MGGMGLAFKMTSEVIDPGQAALHAVCMTSQPILDDRPLRRAQAGNALFSTISGLWLIVDSSTLSPHFGNVPPAIFTGLGGGLLLFAAWLIWQITRPQPRLAHAFAAALADLSWVIGTIVLAVGYGAYLSTPGLVMLGTTTGIVAVAAVAQLRGIDRFVHAFDLELGTDCHYRIAVDVDAPIDRLWPVVADLAGIVNHSPQLTSATMNGPCDVGGVRQCTNRQGHAWAEEVTGWEEGHRFQVRFRSEAANFPFPMDPMHGGWILEPRPGDRTHLTVWWSFTTRPPWAAVLLVPLMDARAGRGMRAVIHSMAKMQAGSVPSHGVA